MIFYVTTEARKTLVKDLLQDDERRFQAYRNRTPGLFSSVLSAQTEPQFLPKRLMKIHTALSEKKEEYLKYL